MLFKLGGPTRHQLCSKRARTGSGARSTEPLTLENTTSTGAVEIWGCGKVCEVERRTPDDSFQPFIASPAPSDALETATVWITIPYTAVASMKQPFTLVIRTPRGVRYVDLGMPPAAQIDASGRFLNANGYYLRDCLEIIPLAHGRFGMGWGVHVDVFKPRPLEEPDWSVYLQSVRGIIVQLVGVTHLDPGELSRFRDSPMMTKRLRFGPSVSAEIAGRYGDYRTRVKLTRKATGDCTCPSDEWPCKHIRAVRATWETNPASFLDVEAFLRGLDSSGKAELIETIGKIVVAFPQTLALFGVAEFDATDNGDDGRAG